MASPKNPNHLLVEGPDDKFAVVELMAHHIGWPEHRVPVWIDSLNGVNNLLKSDILETRLTNPDIKRLGILLDADGTPSDRYGELRDALSSECPELPAFLPAEGFVSTVSVKTLGSPMRLGIWMMPNNESPGYLEDFLSTLIPGGAKPVWDHAQQSTRTARQVGATYKEAHTAKAEMHTWLAWQDLPSPSAGWSLNRKALDPFLPAATPFVTWFRRLYEV